MEETKEYTGCYHCNSWFEVTDEVKGKYGDHWWMNEWECLNCHKTYDPKELHLNTYPFVYEAFRTVKM